MYKPLTLENLKRVRTIKIDSEHETISLSTGVTGDGDDTINLCPHQSVSGSDDKALFHTGATIFLLQIMEQVTGHEFHLTREVNGTKIYRCR